LIRIWAISPLLMLATLGVASGTLAYAAGTPGSGTVDVQLPPDTAAFKSGLGEQVARSNCTICHSADYIYIQPPLPHAQWEGEVNKMQKVYGCPVPERDVETLVNYLFSQNGSKD
jgi:mono/diheme cytochrome c family protein